MTLIAVVGDCTTTTCVALAAGWTTNDDVVVLEADPAGGSLAGWLDTPSSPSLATIVAKLGRGTSDADALSTMAAMTHRSTSGIRFVAAPMRSLAADRAIDEAHVTLIPALATCDPVVLADLGRRRPAEFPATLIGSAATTLVIHRQHAASPSAEAVRLERLVESFEQLAAVAHSIVLAVIGDAPFDPAEIAQHVDSSAPETVAEVVTLADDPLAAAALAGRAGVSANRLRRLPLMRSAAAAADRLALRTTPPLSRASS